MTFEEAINVENFFTMDFIYGGVALKFSGLTADQEYLFVKWFNDYAFTFPHKVSSYFSGGINSTEQAERAYAWYGHLSPVRYPRVVGLCETTYNVSTGERNHNLKSWVVGQLATTVHNILNMTLDNKINVYGYKEKVELKRYMQLDMIKKQPNLVVLPMDDSLRFESLDVHAAMSEIDIKSEQISEPIAFLNNEHKVDRLLDSVSLRAEALAELMIRL